MRAFVLACLALLAGCVLPVRVERFAAASPASFVYAAKTNTVMTENDDGEAESLRRSWLADALRAHAMCPVGYVVDTRRYVPNPQGMFANGGDIVYTGRCLR